MCQLILEIKKIRMNMNLSIFYGRLSPLMAWYTKNDRPLPWRTLWSEGKDPYVVWISEIMLQQTTIKVVEPKYIEFIKKFPTLNDLALAPDSSVREAVRGLGYYRRFHLMHQCAQLLAKQSSPKLKETVWPKNSEGLRALPGIGPYTAAAIASIAFGEKVAVLDGNVERVLCRLLGLKINPREPQHKKALSKVAQDLLEKGYDKSKWHEFSHSLPGIHNQSMMELGQLICTPQNPQCNLCPLKKLCKGFEEQAQNEIPLPPERKQSIQIEMLVQILARKKQGQMEVALFERHHQARFLKGTRGFMSDWRVSNESLDRHDLKADYPFLGTVRHSITHHKIKAHVLGNLEKASLLPARKNWKRDCDAQNIQWVPFENTEAALVSNLDRKAWKVFQKSLLPAKLRQ
jgi:A/G-specific adenine glycosylase